MNRHILRVVAFAVLMLLAMLLVAATFMEKYYGTAVTITHVYHSPLFIATWAVLALSAIAYIICVSRRVTLVMLHVSLVIVLLGAFTSFMTSKRGELMLSRDAAPASMFTTADGDLERLPFRITLERIDIHHIEGEVAGYHAHIAVRDGEREQIMEVSLNAPATIDGHSLCIKGVSDGHVSLMVSYDPWGVPISYTGYALCIMAFVMLFIDRKSGFRQLLNKFRKQEQDNNEGTSRVVCNPFVRGGIILLLCSVALAGTVRWYRSGTFPATDGHESLMLLAWLSALLGVTFTYSKGLRQFAGMMLMTGCVAAIASLATWSSSGSSIPPILRTPLLGIHVSAVIAAYVLLGCTAINAATAIWYGCVLKDRKRMESMAHAGRIMLYPATMLLTMGISIGAVWANISWGRYWGWDPKEVWALITLIICSIAFHTRSLPFMGKAVNFHIFCLVAFLAMLFTFFGVNYLFGGLHSYM